jgi:hypothetical protein
MPLSLASTVEDSIADMLCAPAPEIEVSEVGMLHAQVAVYSQCARRLLALCWVLVANMCVPAVGELDMDMDTAMMSYEPPVSGHFMPPPSSSEPAGEISSLRTIRY